MAPKRVAAI